MSSEIFFKKAIGGLKRSFASKQCTISIISHHQFSHDLLVQCSFATNSYICTDQLTWKDGSMEECYKMLRTRLLDFWTSIILQTYSLFLIFLNLTFYFGGIRLIVVYFDKICRQDGYFKISRNLLVGALSKSSHIHL